jgi:superfamily II DNA or RNA helicase
MNIKNNVMEIPIDDYEARIDADEGFQPTFNPKLVYVFRINDLKHNNLLKIGDATLKTDIHPEDLAKTFPDNCHALMQAAKARIKQYTHTAAIKYDLLYTTLAVTKNDDGELISFRDKKVHQVLKRSGINNFYFDQENKRNEWFQVDLQTAKKAIGAVKAGRDSLAPNEITHDMSPIVFRPEQQDAIDKAIKKFKKGNRMLWNAKMRFGKTLSALKVIRECKFRRSIIFTHRPAVNDGWFEDFQKIFYDTDNWMFGSKTKGSSLTQLEHSGKNYVYFASIQDLRGSKEAGGKFEKNDEVFSTPWDFAIIDEAHEGTQTSLGENVINLIVHEGTKTLELSGTPFNLIDQFSEDEVYTWDYVMEQKAKQDYRINHYGDYNPYDELPQMQIYTYNLDSLIEGYESDDMAFNFHEFFRTWREDSGELPIGANVGDFVHKKDVRRLLDLIASKDGNSNYPFSTDAYRLYFRHSLWMVPGVKEARALAEMIRQHDAFSNFEVVNVAGDGDEEENSLDALSKVKRAIRENEYTITLSCGRLTTGITVPEWTAVFMLAGTFSTSASSYLQTIFRVQSPAKVNGCVKDRCYVFDFAPDRTLKMVAEASRISTRPGKGNSDERLQLGEFLNFCPVISVKGSSMKEYDVSHMMRELKKSYVNRVVHNGFDDPHIYNDELLKLTDVDINDFEELKKVVGSSKQQTAPEDLTINDQGYTNEEYDAVEDAKKKPKKERTPEEEAMIEEHKKKMDSRRKAMSILRAISIRIPMLIYGAELNEGENITVENFADHVDAQSWKEFMPEGVTKDKFKRFAKYYDRDIFESSGLRIRAMAKGADELLPMERVKQIARLFSTFKNPDKETVLTPWRVVNMHISDCLGGWDFYSELHRDDAQNDDKLDQPRFVDRGEVTADTLNNPEAKILEINSKSGLYPLYCAYSIYRARCNEVKESQLTEEYRRTIWKQTLAENIFVICKTPMAKSITRRTLLGFEDGKVNAHYFDDLINQIKNKPNNFITKVTKPSYWNINNETMMKFNAIVGNPPYQEETAKHETQNGQKAVKNIFQYFQIISDSLGRYISLIYPGGRWIHRSGKGLEDFGKKQINDTHLQQLIYFPDWKELFPDAGIADGISIVMKDMKKVSFGFLYIYENNGIYRNINIDKKPEKELIPLNPADTLIIEQIKNIVEKKKFKYLNNSIYARTLFGIESSFVEKNPEKVREYNEGDFFDVKTEIKLFTNDKAGKAGRARWYITKRDNISSGVEYIDKWKVVVSSANAGGQKRSNQIAVLDNHSVFGRSRVALKTFDTEEESQNFFKYAQSHFIRFAFLMTDESLTSLAKWVPDIENYKSNNGIIDFSEDINNEVYNLFGISSQDRAYIDNVIAKKDE